MRSRKGRLWMIFFCEGAPGWGAMASWTSISIIARPILELTVFLHIRYIKLIPKPFLQNRKAPNRSQPSSKPPLSMQSWNDSVILFIMCPWKKLILSLAQQRTNVIDFLMMDLNCRSDPFHTIAFLPGPYNLSYFDGTLGALQFDFVLASLRKPRRRLDKVRRALLSV